MKITEYLHGEQFSNAFESMFNLTPICPSVQAAKRDANPSGHIAASSEFSNRFFTSSSCKGAASSDYPQEGNAARSCASRCSCRITQPVPNSIATHIIPSGKETRKTTYGVGRELSCIIPLPIPIINHDYLQACPGDI